MKTLFFDVDTQLDFLYPAGALYVPGAEEIVGTLGRLTKFAAAKGIQIVSTMDAHSEDDPEFKSWPPHCVAGTAGQQKAAATLVDKRVVLNEADEAQDAPQILVEKQSIDCFTNPNLSPLLELIKPERIVLYGVATEICVQCAASGLLKTGARIELVTDAIKGINEAAERDTIQRFQAQGGLTVKSSDVLA